jgi:hypothetical protein
MPGNGSGQPIPPVELLDALVELDADVLLLDDELADVDELVEAPDPPEPPALSGVSTATLAPHPRAAERAAPASQEARGKRMLDP